MLHIELVFGFSRRSVANASQLSFKYLLHRTTLHQRPVVWKYLQFYSSADVRWLPVVFWSSEFCKCQYIDSPASSSFCSQRTEQIRAY